MAENDCPECGSKKFHTQRKCSTEGMDEFECKKCGHIWQEKQKKCPECGSIMALRRDTRVDLRKKFYRCIGCAHTEEIRK